MQIKCNDYKINLIKNKNKKDENIQKYNSQKEENAVKLKNRLKQFKNKETNIKNKKLILDLEREIEYTINESKKIKLIEKLLMLQNIDPLEINNDYKNNEIVNFT